MPFFIANGAAGNAAQSFCACFVGDFCGNLRGHYISSPSDEVGGTALKIKYISRQG